MAEEENNLSPSKDETASRRAVQGASLLILLQVVSRAITFVANQLLLRFLTAQLLGVSTQLEVYYLSVIFFARESLRVAIQRQDSSSPGSVQGDGKDEKRWSQDSSTQAVVNLGYLAIGLGIPLAVGFGWLYLYSLSTETLASTPYLVISLYIYALAAIIELISEPAFVVMQARLQFSTRATAESIATFIRCIVTLGSAVWGATMLTTSPKQAQVQGGLQLGVLPFALGQLSYGLGLLAVYLWYGSGLASREGFSLLPRRIVTQPKRPSFQNQSQSEFALSYFYRPTLQLASSMMAQSIVKHILTQGDTFLVSILSTPTAQGVYALANNYGGLVARLVFQPIEESSRSYFSKLLSPTTSTSTQPTPLQQARTALISLLHLYTLLSLAIITLAPPAAPLFLTFVAGPTWSTTTATTTLSAYTFYIPLLAVNGISEAFVSSVATRAQVHSQSAWMGCFSLVFATAGFVFLRVLDMGAVGLVVANGINMACRIVWCWWFIKAYFREKGTKGEGEFDVLSVLPRGWVVLAAAVTAQVVRRVPVLLGQVEFLKSYIGEMAAPFDAKQALVQLVAMGVVAVPFVGLLLFSERRFLVDGYRSLTRR